MAGGTFFLYRYIIIKMRLPVTVLYLLFLSISLFAQSIQPPVPADQLLFSDTGDTAIARRYLEWAQREAGAGRNAEAIAALERAVDYTAVSSDLSYYMALLQEGNLHRSAWLSIQADYSRFSIIEKCRLALETNRWEHYTPEEARLLEAKMLTGLRFFEETLYVLRYCDSEKYITQYSSLLALRGLAQSHGEEAEFLKALSVIMDRFPREPGPVKILFDYASRSDSIEHLRPLIDLALRRLPILIDSDPKLAYMAAPFIYDRETVRSYVAAFRAAGNPSPASLPAALNLGLVSGTQAVEELFAWRGSDPGKAVLDRELIVTVSRLLRSDSERALLLRNLLQFSGVIIEDRDHDGIAEVFVTYQNGLIREYSYDSNQDGKMDVRISFAQGLPDFAVLMAAPGGYAAFLSGAAEANKVTIYWERYPAVFNAEMNGKRYILRPLDYFYTPVRFAPLVLGGPDYPLLNDALGVVTERSLLSFSNILEQPSTDFPGETERIELSGGIPVKSTVYAGGKKVSETEFRLGRPHIQYLDLDMDGRMETIRRYDAEVPYRILVTESDWDGDGIYEYSEILQSDGSIKKSWNNQGRE